MQIFVYITCDNGETGEQINIKSLTPIWRNDKMINKHETRTSTTTRETFSSANTTESLMPLRLKHDLMLAIVSRNKCDTQNVVLDTTRFRLIVNLVRSEFAETSEILTPLGVCDLTQILVVDGVGIWVKSQTTSAWSRPVETCWNVAHLFRQTRSKVSIKYAIILILVAMNNKIQTDVWTRPSSNPVDSTSTGPQLVDDNISVLCTGVLRVRWRNAHLRGWNNTDTSTM